MGKKSGLRKPSPNSTLSLERMDGLISPSEGLKGPSERANGSAGAAGRGEVDGRSR